MGAWASVLSSLAREGSLITGCSGSPRPSPTGTGRAVLSRAEAAADAASACTASYDALLDDMDSHTCAHDVVLAVQVRLTKSVEVGVRRWPARSGRSSDSSPTPTWRSRPCSRPTTSRPSCCAPTSPIPAPAGRPGADPWPMAMEESWSHVRVDGMVHATFWVAEWPRTEVRSDFLAPLLLGSARSTLSVVMEPLGPDTAVRKVGGVPDG